MTALQPAALDQTPEAIVEFLAALDVRRAFVVADSQLADVLAALDGRIEVAHIPREDVALAMAFGAALCGEVVVVIMKNAGLAASLDALLSLVVGAEVPVLLVVGWSGSGSDQVAHHRAVGVATRALFDAAQIDWAALARDEAHDVSSWVGRAERALGARRSFGLAVIP